MTVTSAYMYVVKNLSAMFEAIQKAQVPPRFTHEFLQTLGFKSTNDRAFINVLKGLGFLDSNAVPTQIYKDYRDKSMAKKVLAQQIRSAYQGLYMTDEKAHELGADVVKGKLSSLTGKDESVVHKMASTFTALVKLADFKDAPVKVAPRPEDEVVESPALPPTPSKELPGGLAFSHVLYINLPATHDVAVYNAIFKSIKEHLL
jgi:hypothetical protein